MHPHQIWMQVAKYQAYRLDLCSISALHNGKMKTSEKQEKMTPGNVKAYNEVIYNSGTFLPKGPMHLQDVHNITQGGLLQGSFIAALHATISTRLAFSCVQPVLVGFKAQSTSSVTISNMRFSCARLWSRLYRRWYTLHRCRVRCRHADLHQQHTPLSIWMTCCCVGHSAVFFNLLFL